MGASSALKDKFLKLGLETAEDFVLHLPLRYEDHSVVSFIADLVPGQWGQFDATIVSTKVQKHPRKALIVRVCDEQGDELSLRFLNFYPSQIAQMQEGKKVRVQGELRHSLWGDEMVHPKVLNVSTALSKTLVAIYPSTDKLTQTSIHKAIKTARLSVVFDELLPPDILSQYELMPLMTALNCLHEPSLHDDIEALNARYHPAWRRIKFDELLAQQLSLAQARYERTLIRGPKSNPSQSLGQFSNLTQTAFLKALPFELTASQKRVVAETLQDLTHPFPMNRLIQGDVGSGKTVVAAVIAQALIANGFQVAVMAPTEILAEQHFKKMYAWFSTFGVNTVLLQGSMKSKEKKQALEAIELGQAQLIVGTHALIQDKVVFQRLGLVVVDEQHRFGVAQRLALRYKGEQSTLDYDLPHHLMMTATPIPRTLAMTVFADLDISEINELPPGRTPILTKLLSQARRNEVISAVYHAAQQQQQVYWVCPLVEESEQLDLLNAVETHQMLSECLVGLNVGLVHGKMSSVDKATVMTDFASGKIDVLVATTVIEVGVDVPNATLMVIEHAERFGLAQLHQLRGRVGRGSGSSICVLLYQTPLSLVAKERLRVIHKCQDGFEIARQDLKIRGPGEVLGARQSGMAMMRYADLEMDSRLAEVAQKVANDMIINDPDKVKKHLYRWMRHRQVFLKA